MKQLFLSILVLFLFSFSGNDITKNEFAENYKFSTSKNKVELKVYICNGPKSIAYHSRSNCSGLNNCSTEISEIDLSKAQNMGRRAFKKCH